MSENIILNIPNATFDPNVVETSSYGEFRGTDTPIVIDNGATTMRWGFASSSIPKCQPNIITKYKERKSNRPLLLFGDAVELEGGAKAQARTPWEGDVLLNFDAFESALDYVFLNLGIDTSTVAHPILMSERLATPSHSRALTSELIFELYSAPHLTYCVDSLMSLYQNNQPQLSHPYTASGLVISLNTASTSVIPVIDGKGIMSRSKRIPWSTSQSYEYLQKLIQLKYPNFPARITSSHASWIFHNVCEFSPDYTSLLRRLQNPVEIRSHDRIIQFPYMVPSEIEKTEDEMTRIAERRKEQGRRLQEIAAKQRMEKLVQNSKDLEHLLLLKKDKSTVRKAEWLARLENEGFEDEATLEEAIKKLELKLDEEGLKEKRRQKLMKAGFEARQRAHKEKEREKIQREDEARREQEERENDFETWILRIRQEHQMTMEKIRERKRRKAALSDRKSASSQARMKTIASLASETPTAKKRRKGHGDDDFGADDDDWAVYRKLNIGAPSSDEEDDIVQLQTLEEKLLTFDPSFTVADTFSVLSTQRSPLLEAFLPRYDENDIAGQCKVHLSTERWRSCEPWFNPSMAGVDTAGLGEVLANVLSTINETDKRKLVQNVFVTGTPAVIPGFVPRLQATLRPILDPDTTLRITLANDVSLDSWNGMRTFAYTRPEELLQHAISKQEYEEHGGERIKRWWGSNWNWAI
ncbi:hypothetical protein Clacol_003622 [Clathrus columnatus]|uniref:Actin-related protein 5 n=1 Tax=Clathrus columnatus TaxID=1419009 RepID=A0AAV5ABU4_9AGAM|nr:hypothetical protein Clacol_003622 [Clathrus columnatus]